MNLGVCRPREERTEGRGRERGQCGLCVGDIGVFIFKCDRYFDLALNSVVKVAFVCKMGGL